MVKKQLFSVSVRDGETADHTHVVRLAVVSVDLSHCVRVLLQLTGRNSG